MTRYVGPHRLLIVVVLALLSQSCEAASDGQTTTGMDGYLGLGEMRRPDYMGAAHEHTSLAPIANFDYNDVFYIYIDRVGARFWSTANREIALGVAAEPQFGFSPQDGPRLVGMRTRRDSLQGGPAIDWQRSAFAASLAFFFDLSDTSHGQALNLSLFQQVIDRRPWDIGIYESVDYADKKVMQYYFGVTPQEATPTRPVYSPGAAANLGVGLTGAYRLSEVSALLFGVEIDKLGATAAGSPIIERSLSYTAYLGGGLAF